MMQTRRKRKNDRALQTTCTNYRYTQHRKMSGDCNKYSRLYSMDDICEYLQNGGNRLTQQQSRRRVHTLQLLAEFVRTGWRSEFIHATFRRMNDVLLHEYPRHKFIEEYAKTAIRHLDIETQGSIRDSLLQIGLRSDISIQLESIVAPLQGSCYTDVQVLDTAIYYLLGYYKPLTPPNTKHLIQSDTVNTWFTYTHESKTINVYNLVQPCLNTPAIQSQFNTVLSSLPNNAIAGEFTYHFHTTSWKSSLSIIESVDRQQGRKCLDFGIYPGFYISNTVQDCIEWGHANRHVWSNEIAILIFAIPKILPSTLTFKELVGDEWIQVTKHSRKCQDTADMKLIKSVDLLYGDMVQNATAVRNGSLPLTHTPPKKQLVSKSDAGDAFVHSCLIGCVYFQKNLSL